MTDISQTVSILALTVHNGLAQISRKHIGGSRTRTHSSCGAVHRWLRDAIDVLLP